MSLIKKKKKPEAPVGTGKKSKKEELEELKRRQEELEEDMDEEIEETEEEDEDQADDEEETEEEEQEEEQPETSPVAQSDQPVLTKTDLILLLKRSWRRLYDIENQLKQNKVFEKDESRVSNVREKYMLVNDAETTMQSIRNLEKALREDGMNKQDVAKIKTEALDLKQYEFWLLK